MTLELGFYKLHAEAILPSKAHTSQFEDAAYDLFYCGKSSIVLEPNEHHSFPTGLSCIIPEGYWLKFHGRSGLATKKGIQVLAGVIDSGYTGELRVVLENTSDTAQTIEGKSAICQFTLEKINHCKIIEIDEQTFEYEQSNRERGTNGFGSTDKRKR